MRSHTSSSLYEIKRIDDADNCRIDRAILVTLGHAGRRSANDDNPFVKAGADSVDSHDVTALVGPVKVDRLHDQKFFAKQTLVLLGGNDRALNAPNYHRKVPSSEFRVSSRRRENSELETRNAELISSPPAVVHRRSSADAV